MNAGSCKRNAETNGAAVKAQFPVGPPEIDDNDFVTNELESNGKPRGDQSVIYADSEFSSLNNKISASESVSKSLRKKAENMKNINNFNDLISKMPGQIQITENMKGQLSAFLGRELAKQDVDHLLQTFEPVSQSIWNVLRIWYNAEEELLLSSAPPSSAPPSSTATRFQQEPAMSAKRKSVDEGPQSTYLCKVKSKKR